MEARYAGFADFLQDRLSDGRRAILEKVLPELPRLEERHVDSRSFTLIHGDAHPWNFLYPRSTAQERVRIVDWEKWRLDAGAMDLACLIALNWYPDRRASVEKPLLRRYLENLASQGIADYGWDELWTDYRICVIRNLFSPVNQWHNGVAPAFWWSHIERSMMAFQDLGCVDLLDGQLR